MADLAPICFIWDGDAMIPATRRFAVQADKQYVVGENYVLVPHEARSAESHRHFFAAIHDAWQNLPEDMADEFRTPEHLRKWALVKAGFADHRKILTANNDEAVNLAAAVKLLDNFAVVEIAGRVVNIWTAHSQSMKAMGKARFQASKQKVLDVIAGMIGVTPEALSSNAARAA